MKKYEVAKTDAEWKKKLNQEQYEVLRNKATERPGSGIHDQNWEKGTYICAGCGTVLFESDDKFDAGCGWPSYTKPASSNVIEEQKDTTHGMERTEVLCSKCGGHLGHVFNDGPKDKTGLRYCINSASLAFKKAEAKDATNGMERAVLATGCFWCNEAIFQRVKGVSAVKSGYIGGKTENPTYKQVCEGNTDHAEACEIYFDPKELSFKDLLKVFWQIHDPTSLNKQGGDIGTQYRSAIFYTSDRQKKDAEESMKEAQKKFDKPIVTEITNAAKFYPAEDYHQNFYNNNPKQPYCDATIPSKLKKLGLMK